ncbi:hypothetical protein QBC47DRAFT_386892 [Echria macrotheca]|uniref:Rhodopsin domain-containing protein n=1 Tax=Echria macrotheca TaxID=438768 RepID=A0AAJ0B8J3_9PEZI|nr:hypothetical protein QBC47DRAFT_386892 [Echria macrotheca]
MAATNSTAAGVDPARLHESRAYQLTTTVIVCPIFAGIFTALRLYTRLVLTKKYFWEDLAIGTALVCSIVMSVLNYLAVVYGSGRHVETISAADMVDFVKVGIAITQFYSLTHFFLKLSILLQYLRISVMVVERRICQAAIAILCTGYLIFIVLRMVRCIPFDAQWNPSIPGARCFFNGTWFIFSSQAWNMIMDFVIVILPLFLLRHSNAPLIQRVLIGIVLAFGASAGIISVVRLQTLLPSSTSADPSWDKVPSAIYGLIEINVGITCASVVALRPLYRSIRQRFTDKEISQGTLFSMPPQDVGPQGSHAELVFDGGSTTRVDSKCDGLELDQVSAHHSEVSVDQRRRQVLDA